MIKEMWRDEITNNVMQEGVLTIEEDACDRVI
jgi:hypothetical protein